MLDTLRQTFTDNWIAWAYQYGLGGIFFWVTLAIGIRSGALHLRSRRDRRVAAALVIGLFLFAGGHALWITAVQGPPGARPQAEIEQITLRAAPIGRGR